MTHWLGGTGIITLALAIFPAMGVSGYGMYRGEVPGPTKERLMPRLADTINCSGRFFYTKPIDRRLPKRIFSMDHLSFYVFQRRELPDSLPDFR